MKIYETDGFYGVESPAFLWRQAKPYEIVHGNGYSFHAAAKPAPEDIGQRRTFIRFAYAPAI